MECDKKFLEKGKLAKIDATSKINKKSKKSKCKRKVTFGSSMGDGIFSSRMERLIITQKVKVKKQKIKCTINLTNICKKEAKPRKTKISKTEENLSIPGHSEDRIVPECMRKKCKLAVESKTKCCRQVEDSFIGELKERTKVSIKTNKRTRSKRNKHSYKSPKRIDEKRNISYETISSDNFSIYSYVDEKLDTLIMRTKARDRKQKNSYPTPLYTSTPILQPADELEDITSISNEIDFSEDSQVTFILEPRSDNANNLSIFENDVAAREFNSEDIKVESKCDDSDATLNINALSATNLVISVDPVIVKCEQNSVVNSEQHLQKNTQDSCELNSKVISLDSSEVCQLIVNMNANSAMDLVKSEEPPININKLNSNREKKTEMIIKPNSKNYVSQGTLDRSAFFSKNLRIPQENAVICPEHNTKNSKSVVNQMGLEIKTENIEVKPENIVIKTENIEIKTEKIQIKTEIISKETKYSPQSSSSTIVHSETNKPISVINSTKTMAAPVMGPNRNMPEPSLTTHARSQSAAYTSIFDKIEKECYYSDPEESYYPPDWDAPNFMFRHEHTLTYDACMYSGTSYVPVWPADFIYNSGQYNSMESPINYLYLETPHFPATTYSAAQYVPANKMYSHQTRSNCTSQMYSNTHSANDMYRYQPYHNNNKNPHKSQKFQNVPRRRQTHTHRPYYPPNGAKLYVPVTKYSNIDTVPITSERIKLEPKTQRSPVRIKIEENVQQAVKCEPKVIIKQEIIDNDYKTENNNNTVQEQGFERKPLVTNGMNNTNGDNLVRFIKKEPCD